MFMRKLVFTVRTATMIGVLIGGFMAHDPILNFLGFGDNWVSYLPKDQVENAQAVHRACNKSGVQSIFYNEKTCQMVKDSSIVDLPRDHSNLLDGIGNDALLPHTSGKS